MADFKYIMQGFQKDINFFDEIKEVLETEDYTSIWILTALVIYKTSDKERYVIDIE